MQETQRKESEVHDLYREYKKAVILWPDTRMPK